MGFVPLAFRSGSAKKSRMHIFWQRRICAGDTTTPYWFPSQTSSGTIREDRLVLPIPPGTHWSDAKPIVMPGEEANAEGRMLNDESGKVKAKRERKEKVVAIRKEAIVAGGLRFTATPVGAEIEVVKPER